MHDILPRPAATTISPLTPYRLDRMVLSPHQWRTYQLRTPLQWEKIRFTPANAQHVPQRRGVYSFVIQPGIANHPCCSHLMYIGQTEAQNFRTRYRQYLREQRIALDANPRRYHVTQLLRNWRGYLWFIYAPVNGTNRITRVENALLSAYLPPANRAFPATIRPAVHLLFNRP